MISSDAGREASARLRRVGWFLHANVVETKFRALDRALKSFDPDQPRVPAGDPDGGQWTGGSGGTGGRLPSGPGTLLDLGDGDEAERVRVAANDPPDHLSDVRPRPRNLPRDIQELSDIPRERPSSIQVANAVAKFVAYEFADYLMRQGERPLAAGTMRSRLFRRLLSGFEIALWVRDEGLPAIESYYDPPRTLEELQDAAAAGHRPGYEIHHIVERNSKSNDDADRINAPENLVSVPVFKHHLITGRFAKKSKEFGGMSPRNYLRGKSWEERTRIGLEALIDKGVLHP